MIGGSVLPVVQTLKGVLGPLLPNQAGTVGFIAGMGGGITEVLLTQPLDTVTTRAQTQGTSVLQTLRNMQHSNLSFYTGWRETIYRNMLGAGATFGVDALLSLKSYAMS